MFTGIVEEIGKVVTAQPAGLTMAASEVLHGMARGGSMAVNGVCLTITRRDNRTFSVDIMPETGARSNLGSLKTGDRVNLERPLALGGRLGGHLVQGHIDDTGRVAAVRRTGTATLITFEASPEVLRYVVEKGFIAVDGVSLTITDRDARSFQVSVVNYSLQHTTLGERRPGDAVNLEVDIIAKYVEQFSQARRAGVTLELLQEHGFLVG